MKRIRIRRLSLRELVVIGLPSLTLVFAGFWVASKFIKPAPPDRIVISTGGEGGAYYGFAKRYAEILAREGVTLEVRTSAGSLENLKRLQDPAGDVEVAFVQGGIKPPEANAEDTPVLVQLASVGYEPLWVFVRAKKPVNHLTQLKRQRLAVGPEGSGTRALAALLLDANGMNTGPPLLPLGGQAAADALVKGEVDAAFFVAAQESPVVRALLARKDVQLANFATSEAYSRRFPFLARLTLPQSSISFTENIPPRDIALLSPTARLVAREDAHPALLYLLLQAASETHRAAGLFQRAGEFPVLQHGDFESSKEAERYFRQGLPFLQRVLPFWLANLVERLWVLLLPVVAIVIPLMKIVPPIYAWRVKSRFFRRYGELRYIEAEVDRASGSEGLQTMLDRIARLEDEVRTLPVPLAYSDFFYTFRTHVGMVRAKIEARLKQG